MVLWNINHCRSFNTKSIFFINTEYIIFTQILLITFLNEPELFFHLVKWFNTQSNDQTVQFQTIQFSMSNLVCFNHCYESLSKVVKLVTVAKGDPKAPFSTATTPTCRGRYTFPWITPLYLDPYLIILSVKQGSIKYHFFSLRYD